MSLGGALKPGPSGARLGGGVNPDQALLWNAGTCRPDAKGEAQAGGPRKSPSTDAGHRDGAVRSRDEGSEALKKLRRDIRRWSLQTRTDKALDDLARMCNPYIRGWINYYSHFYKSALYESLRRIDFHLRKWVRRKYKRFRQRPKGAREWLARIISTNPGPSPFPLIP